MLKYSIKDIEQLCGIKAHTIRIWEQRYNLVKSYRTETNIRYYTNNELKSFLRISLLNRNGLKISKIATMQQEEISENINNLQTNKDNKYQKSINQLIIAMVDLDEVKFNGIITEFNEINGFEYCILNLILPFLKTVGNLWFNNSLSVAYEHFISNIIRKKMLYSIQKLDANVSFGKKVLLFTRQKEIHELSLIMCDYFFKRRGYKTYFIGANTPYESVKEMVEFLKPDIALTVFTVNMNKKVSNNEFIRQMSKDFGKTKLMFCGNLNITESFKYYKNIYTFESFDSLIEHLNIKSK